MSPPAPPVLDKPAASAPAPSRPSIPDDDLPPTQATPVVAPPPPPPPPAPVAPPPVAPPPAPTPGVAPSPSSRPPSTPPPWATGAPADPSVAPQWATGPDATAAVAPVPPRPAPRRARRKGPPVLVILLGIVALVAVGVAGYLVLGQGDGDTTLPAGCSDAQDFVCILEPPVVEGDTLAVKFSTAAAISESGTRVVFLWSPDDEIGDGFTNEFESYVGGSPARFPISDVPDGATQICASLAPADLSGEVGDGNCQDLPAL